jgi:hypothetical protein
MIWRAAFYFRFIAYMKSNFENFFFIREKLKNLDYNFYIIYEKINYVEENLKKG